MTTNTKTTIYLSLEKSGSRLRWSATHDSCGFDSIDHGDDLSRVLRSARAAVGGRMGLSIYGFDRQTLAECKNYAVACVKNAIARGL